MVFAFVVHEEAGDVFGVVEVAHGAEGNGDEGVVIVVATLDLTLVDTHHLKAQAIDANGLSQRRLAGEEPAPCFIADHRHAGALELIFFAEAAPGRDPKTADALVDGIDSGEE